ncbi:MAG: hypothetical protein ACI9WS_000085, partial [Paraglaciecola psychrophila]
MSTRLVVARSRKSLGTSAVIVKCSSSSIALVSAGHQQEQVN